ncbi:hypothetical protein [Sphingobacterium psychroaquaticum]|uniref:hypothetical protein n=1 Tax=Sphingobacterium psychroaquaticum TaxID=561061 RepID=UPI00135652DA|nr:hypothetical protein [Sphingobacterium psychroaquaticum]
MNENQLAVLIFAIASIIAGILLKRWGEKSMWYSPLIGIGVFVIILLLIDIYRQTALD